MNKLEKDIEDLKKALVLNSDPKVYNKNKEILLKKSLKKALGELNKSKGLGDTIKKVTDKLGIKQCGGCKRRQEKLNRLFPYKKDGKKEE